MDQIVFGTRGSPLAIFQTNSVIKKLKVLYPQISYKRKIIKTQGDRDQNSSLTLTEELGLFSNEIQSELKKNNIDVLLDDTDENISSKLKKFDLIGVPYQIILGKNSEQDLLEFKEIDKEAKQLSINEIIKILTTKKK